jgi:Uma2 family endonuclease
MHNQVTPEQHPEMRSSAKATIEDLYKEPGKAELVDGEIILMPSTGYSPNRAGTNILFSLTQYERQTGIGQAFSDGAGFIMDPMQRKVFSPDVAFHTGLASKGLNMRFVEGAPIFAVEIRSENDYGSPAEQKMAAKRSDYFAAGTQVVWDVDLQSESVVRSYRIDEPNHPTIYRRGDMATAEPALPGWVLPVDDLFR